MQRRKYDLPDQKVSRGKHVKRDIGGNATPHLRVSRGVQCQMGGKTISGTREGIAGSGEKKMGNNEEINERMKLTT